MLPCVECLSYTRVETFLLVTVMNWKRFACCHRPLTRVLAMVLAMVRSGGGGNRWLRMARFACAARAGAPASRLGTRRQYPAMGLTWQCGAIVKIRAVRVRVRFRLSVRVRVRVSYDDAS